MKPRKKGEKYMKSRLLGVVRVTTQFTVCVLAILIAVSANASPVIDTEPNNSMAMAQNINAALSLTADINIENSAGLNTSQIIPHAEIQGTGDGTVDYFSFTAAAGANIILDIDCGDGSAGGCTSFGNIDAWLDLYDPSGFLFSSNDYSLLAVDTGSLLHGPFGNVTTDSFIEIGALPIGGVWTVAVGEFPNLQPVPPGGDYVLNVSVSAIPIPAAVWLFGSGLLGLIGISRRKTAA
jgi:hypothetical protein